MDSGISALSGVVVGSLFTWVKDWRSEKKTLSRKAKYLATRIICILRKYAEDCAQVVNDDGLYLGQPTGANGLREPQVETPAHPYYPEDLDWSCIDPQLMYSILSLPNDAYIADRLIDGTSGIADPPDYEEFFEERQHQYACMGIKALELEKRIRDEYEIETEDAKTTLFELFIKGKKSVEESRAIRQKSYEKFLAEHPVK